MTTETKFITALLLIYLWFHWRTVSRMLAIGAGGPGNKTLGVDSTGGNWQGCGPGQTRWPDTWGTAL